MKYKETLENLVEKKSASENDLIALIESVFQSSTEVNQKPIQTFCPKENKPILSPGFQVKVDVVNENQAAILLASLVGAKNHTTPPMKIEAKKNSNGKLYLHFELAAEYSAINKRRSGTEGFLDVERLARYVVSREILKKAAEMSVVSIGKLNKKSIIKLSHYGEKKLCERITNADMAKIFYQTPAAQQTLTKDVKQEKKPTSQRTL